MCRHVATALALLLVALWFGEIDAKDKPATIDVRVDEIGESVRLIGRLGVPLEQMITAEGVWQYPPGIAKDGSLIFSVSSVDGKPLEKPVEFYRARVDAIEKRKSVSLKRVNVGRYGALRPATITAIKARFQRSISGKAVSFRLNKNSRLFGGGRLRQSSLGFCGREWGARGGAA